MALTQQSIAITGGSVNRLQSNTAHTVDKYLFVPPMVEFATARINQSAFSKSALAQVTVDTTSADWLNVEAGMRVCIGTSAGACDVGVYRARKTPLATTLYLSELSDGDNGLLATGEHVALADNQYVTIYDTFDAWSVFPRIAWNGTSGTFFKDYDVAYATQNETVVPGYLNIGEHSAGYIRSTDGNTYQKAFTATVGTWLSGDSVSSYQWSARTLTGGSASVHAGGATTNTVTYRFEPGAHIVKCIVTLASGATMTARRFIGSFGDDGTFEYYPHEINILSDTRDLTGRRMQFELVNPDVGNSTILDGSFALYVEAATWDSGTVPESTTQCAGYIQSVSGGLRGNGVKDITFELTNRFEVLKAFSQQLQIVSNPNNWQEVVQEIGHLDFYVFYLLYYHSTLLQLFDYRPSGLTQYKAPFISAPGTLFEQCNVQAARLNCTVGMQSDGTITIARNPDFMTSAEYASEASRMTLTEDDLSSPGGNFLNHTKRLYNTVGAVNASGFYYADGTVNTASAFLSAGPGKTQGQGRDSARLEGQLLDATTPQADLNTRAGQLYASANNPYQQIALSIARNYDVFEPALYDLVTLNIGADYWYEGVAFNEVCIVKRIGITHNPDGTKDFSVIVDKRVAAVSGETVPVPVGNSLPTPPAFSLDDFGLPELSGLWLPPFNTPLPPASTEDVSRTGNYAVAWNANTVQITANARDVNPQWEVVYNRDGGAIVDVILRPDSSLTSGVVNLYILQADKLVLLQDAISTRSISSATIAGHRWLRSVYYDVDSVAIFDNQFSAGIPRVSVSLTGSAIDDTYDGTAANTGRGGDVGDFSTTPFIFYCDANDDLRWVDNITAGTQSTVAFTSALTTDIRCIRIPYRKLDNSGLNNSATAFDVLVSSEDKIYLCTINTVTNTMTAQLDRTPSISATDYFADNVNRLETNGSDPRRMMAFLLPVGGGSGILAYTENGYASSPVWTQQQALSGFYLRWYGKNSAWLVSSSGIIYFTDDNGATISDRTGNFNANDSAAAIGAFGL